MIKLIFKNILNLSFVMLFFNIAHAQEDSTTYELTNKIFSFENSIDEADDYNSFLEIYREIRLTDGRFYFYHLLEDTLNDIGSYKIVPPNLLVVELNDSLKTKVYHNYIVDNEIVTLKGLEDTTYQLTLYPVLESELPLSEAVTSYLKSERHKLGWRRFHYYLKYFKGFSQESIVKASEHWEFVVWGIIGGE